MNETWMKGTKRVYLRDLPASAANDGGHRLVNMVCHDGGNQHDVVIPAHLVGFVSAVLWMSDFRKVRA